VDPRKKREGKKGGHSPQLDQKQVVGGKKEEREGVGAKDGTEEGGKVGKQRQNRHQREGKKKREKKWLKKGGSAFLN